MSLIRKLAAIAADFWRETPESYIGIHCSYGFNRTGFVLACYIAEVHGLGNVEAMACFAQARPFLTDHVVYVPMPRSVVALLSCIVGLVACKCLLNLLMSFT